MKRTQIPLVLIMAQALWAQGDLRGIYVYTNDLAQVSKETAAQLTQSFSAAGVDGVAIVVGWNTIEPSMGQYDWTILDQWLNQVSALGKKIDLVVPAGMSTPVWLFDAAPKGAGAAKLTFTVSPHGGQTGVCDTITIAAPWDAAFLSRWDAMLAALSAHLKAAGTYSAVTLMRLTGINRTTEELRLPAETAASTGLACVSDSISIWQQAGYKPSLLLKGWNAVVNSFKKSFPDKAFAVSIIPNDAFPGINETGGAIKGEIGDEDEPLLQAASQLLPTGKFIVQFDFLMPGETASPVVTGSAQNYGALVAFQTNEYLGINGAACSEPVTNAAPCTASTYLALLETGIYPLGQSNSLRAQYIEVFHANAAAFPDSLWQAHNELLANASPLILSPDGITVYDPVNNITWLTNFNLAASNRFGLPVCKGPAAQGCVNASGSMHWDGAVAWLAAMNAASYLGQSNWQFPTTPTTDPTCTHTGPNGNSFGFGCTASALATLYRTGLGLQAPASAVPIPDNRAGAFSNFQPYLYWTQGDASANGYSTVSFNSGFAGANTKPNFLYVLPMIPGKVTGAPAASTVYDPVTNVTWLANANIAATNAFGLPTCTSPTTPTLCVATDGAMSWDSASQFVKNMNAAAHLGQKNWQLSPGNPNCTGYGCSSNTNPLVELYYGLLGLNAGTPVVAAPNVTVGPFNNIQPYLYWSCTGATIQSPCSATPAAPNFEWTFSLGNGFTGTDLFNNEFYVAPYFVGAPSWLNVPIISTSGQLPAGVNGIGYSQVLSAAGGAPPYTWTLTDGALPAGLALTPDGTISGVPTATGVATFTVQVTDSNSATGSLALTLVIQPPPPVPLTFYVSPSGNDSWSGLLTSPTSDGTDGPLATFDGARAAVQTANSPNFSQITVQFRGGTYYLTSTVQFTAADSGSSVTPIVYQNYPGETPVFSGGVPVQNWTSAGGDRWTTTLPASAQYFENLFYNGARRLRPRLGGALGAYFRFVAPVYLAAAGPPAKAPDSNCSVYFTGKGWECYDRFQYDPKDPIVNTWKNLSPPKGNPCNQPVGKGAPSGDIELVNFERWSVSKLRISCVDTTQKIVYLTGDTATEADHPTAHGFIPDHRYLIENVQDALTQPGQWFLDRSTTPWTLTYLAGPGENPNNDTVIVPQLTQLLVASSLQYVTFQGLTFSHDNYTIPDSGYDGSSDIISAISFQNSQNITFDSNIVNQTSGAGLEFISCVDRTSKPWCVARSTSAVNKNNVVQNSAFYDIAADAIRIGISGRASDTNDNVAQFITVQNNVVEGYGRVFASSKGITQGQGHDNLYTHNDVYDGYKGAIKVCYCAASDTNPPFTNNNTVSFNHVYNLFQGIMNDSGSLYFGVGTPSPPSSGHGNKMLNNVVHDVSDASALDSDGYGGDGLYLDDFTGLSDVENNLVYRVSGNAISFSGPRAGPNQSSTVKNNIFAFARQSMLNAYDPYSFNVTPPVPMFFTASNNLLYFDRTESQSFYPQGGCTYPGAIAYTAYQQWTSNLYWRADGAFAADAQAFHVQQSLDAMGACGNSKLWKYYNLAGWQALGEDSQSVIKNPGFKNPAYPADDYSLPKGSPGVGFIVFDPSQAGRSNPVLMPPAVAPTFPTKTFDPAKDY